jgi:hypothetical protein
MSPPSLSGVRASLRCRRRARDGMVASHSQRNGAIEGLALSWCDPPTLRR